MSQATLGYLHQIEHNRGIPSWRCEAVRRSDFKRVSFWLRGSQIVTEEQARCLAQMAMPHLDCSPKTFRCEKRLNELPPPNRKRVPVNWFEWGTNRMRAEIDAGLRPFSEYLLPPIETPQRRINSPLGRIKSPIKIRR